PCWPFVHTPVYPVGERGQEPSNVVRVGFFRKPPVRQKATDSRSTRAVVNWRVAVDRAEKREFVTGLNDVFKSTGSVVVAHYAGLTVANMNDLRSKMRAAGGSVKVAKNRLAVIALQGTDSEGMQDLFKGQTLIAYAEDPVAAPKIAADFAKGNDKLVILGGAMGSTVLDANGVKALALRPSRLRR